MRKDSPVRELLEILRCELTGPNACEVLAFFQGPLERKKVPQIFSAASPPRTDVFCPKTRTLLGHQFWRTGRAVTLVVPGSDPVGSSAVKFLIAAQMI